VKNLNGSEAIPKYMFLVSYPGKKMLSIKNLGDFYCIVS
jgi:hypothetical protein